LVMAQIQWGKQVRPYATWGIGTRLYHTPGRDISTWGSGGYLWWTWHIVRRERWSLSYNNGVGPNLFVDSFPSGGTRFNFTTHYGLQFTVKIKDHHLHINLSNIHISNADIKGRDANPALDAIGFQVALTL
jgi:Lipid A 3-O-deacylase (PagL).